MKIIKLPLKVLKGLFIGVLILALLFNAIGIFRRVALKESLPLVMGFGNAVIISGSMEPAIDIGDMVIVHKQNGYEVGDVVSYHSSTPVTHRIVEKTPDGYITQGDANNARDQEIEKSRVIGKVIKIIPKVGTVIFFFQEPLGMVLLLLVLFALIEIPIFFRKVHDNPREGANLNDLRR